MHRVLLVLCVAFATLASAIEFDKVNGLAVQGLGRRTVYDLEVYINNTIHGRPNDRKCDLRDISVRRAWEDLSKRERKEYIDAVLCLQKKESITPRSEVPGVRTRFDDFVATHINQTWSIHETGTFLLWHRYFTWTYEQALRDECGYTGAQPYWDWGRYANDIYSSPVFDGSETSMSGDGEFVEHNGSVPMPGAFLPSGKGGGCVKSGPFKDMVVNLGPVLPNMDGIEPNGDGLSYNPRCLRRDISQISSEENLQTDQVYDLITDQNNIYWFQHVLQGDFDKLILGVHSGGHYVIGGDPGADLATSPGDPAFYFHHAQIDRIYWIWQNQDPAVRLHDVSETHTMFNQPPSPNVTLSDTINMGYNGKAYTLGEMLSTTDGPFCYIYM